MASNEKKYRPPWQESYDYYCGDIAEDQMLANIASKRGGFIAQPVMGESLDALLCALKKGHLIIVRVLSQNTTGDEMISKGREGYGHYMVLVGMDNKYVYLNDPGRSKENRIYGKNKRYTLLIVL